LADPSFDLKKGTMLRVRENENETTVQCFDPKIKMNNGKKYILLHAYEVLEK